MKSLITAIETIINPKGGTLPKKRTVLCVLISLTSFFFSPGILYSQPQPSASSPTTTSPMDGYNPDAPIAFQEIRFRSARKIFIRGGKTRIPLRTSRRFLRGFLPPEKTNYTLNDIDRIKQRLIRTGLFRDEPRLRETEEKGRLIAYIELREKFPIEPTIRGEVALTNIRPLYRFLFGYTDLNSFGVGHRTWVYASFMDITGLKLGYRNKWVQSHIGYFYPALNFSSGTAELLLAFLPDSLLSIMLETYFQVPTRFDIEVLSFPVKLGAEKRTGEDRLWFYLDTSPHIALSQAARLPFAGANGRISAYWEPLLSMIWTLSLQGGISSRSNFYSARMADRSLLHSPFTPNALSTLTEPSADHLQAYYAATLFWAVPTHLVLYDYHLDISFTWGKKSRGGFNQFTDKRFDYGGRVDLRYTGFLGWDTALSGRFSTDGITVLLGINMDRFLRYE